mgnify:CR=1 FL=1
MAVELKLFTQEHSDPRRDLHPMLLITPDDASGYLDERIGGMAQAIRRSFFHTDPHPTQHLFEINGNANGVIRGSGIKDTDFLVPRKDLQRIGLEIMGGYGFNPEYHILRSRYDQYGFVTEWIAYPSTRTNGLVFLRNYQYNEILGKSLSVSWDAVDEAPCPKLRTL